MKSAEFAADVGYNRSFFSAFTLVSLMLVCCVGGGRSRGTSSEQGFEIRRFVPCRLVVRWWCAEGDVWAAPVAGEKVAYLIPQKYLLFIKQRFFSLSNKPGVAWFWCGQAGEGRPAAGERFPGSLWLCGRLQPTTGGVKCGRSSERERFVPSWCSRS